MISLGMEEDRSTKSSWLARFKEAFSLDAGYEPLTEQELKLLDRMATYIVKRGMTVPALLMLETSKPLNYIGSQAMAFFEPMVRAVFSGSEYTEIRKILENRTSIEILLQKVEEKSKDH